MNAPEKLMLPGTRPDTEPMAAAGVADGWADIAAACGFADQSHLVREFVALAGGTPGAWRPGG